jgi:ABC-2 type transport system permease protein
MYPQSASLRSGVEFRALGALFYLTLRQHLHGRRLLVLSFLFLLPSLLAVVVRLTPHAPSPQQLEFPFIFNLVPHALATLTALLYAAGIVQDEVEGQTLTYLLLRPLPRWALYSTRLLATVLVTSVVTGAFTLLAFVVLFWNTSELWGQVLPWRALKTTALLALAQVAYCSLFGCLSLVTRRALIAGLAYIVFFEGMLASFPFVARQLTVMYYFRVLCVRWLGLSETREWSLDLTTSPSAAACVVTLLTTSAVLALAGAMLTARREFRMKTPEGV